jgi:glycosyltransferase involved in cell wall biosynthesis
LKVLLVVEPGLDGVFRHVEGLADYLLKANVHVDMAFSSRRSGAAMGQLVDRVRIAGGEGVDLRVTNWPEARDVRGLFRLIRFIRHVRPDVVHAHSSKAGALVRFVALFMRGPRYFYTPHAYHGMAKPLTLRVRFFNWVEHVLGRVGATIAISHDEAEFGRNVLGVPSEHLYVIHNPVDSTRFSPASPEQRRAARAALGIPEGAVLLAMISRMCWQKDPETAYAGVAAVCKQNPDLRFFHLGWGKWKEYLTEKGQQLGFNSQLKILDYVDDPRTFYHAIDGLLVSSRYEAGWALVFLEGMACNLPLMAATCVGMSDIGLASLSHVWTFPTEDVAGCTEAVKRWLAAHRAGIKQCNHRVFAMERLSPSRCYGAVFDLYQNESHGLNVSPVE